MNPALPKDWYYVYLLKSKLMLQSYYIGCTNNLQKRLTEHNEGKVFTTKKMSPLDLVYFEAYKSKDCAYKREKSLKSYGNGLAVIKCRIEVSKKGRAG